MEDALNQFLLEGRAVRGALVDIRNGINELLDSHYYPPVARSLLGQALAASPLLASNLKFEGRINLQFQGDGPIQLLVTQINEALRLRGMLKMARGKTEIKGNPFDDGILSLSIEPRQGSDRYQAMVPVESATLAGALEGYYRMSEQLPTLIHLAAADHRLFGIMLQRMPDVDGGADADCHWTYLTSLFETLSEQEVLRTGPAVVLRRLFDDDAIRLFAPRPVILACNCSRDAVCEMLMSLGADELARIIADQGRIEVTCEFCRRIRTFSEAEVGKMIATSACDGSRASRRQ